LLFVIAVISLDYNVSQYIREGYHSHRWGRLFVFAHWVYRSCECLCRFLALGSTYLQYLHGLDGHEGWAALAWTCDAAVCLAAIAWASRGLTRRGIFLAMPMFGSNLALFADGEGHARVARTVARVLDVFRATEWLVAVALFNREYQGARRGELIGVLGLPVNGTRVLANLLVLIGCGATCMFMRMLSLIHMPPLPPKQDELKENPKVLKHGSTFAKVGQLFGLEVETSLHCRPDGADGLVETLFSKGIGDQFASLLEIIRERDEVRLSRLQAVEKLGHGGFGMVYKVEDASSGALYALKLQRKDKIARVAVREAECLHEVKHPFMVGLVRIFHTVVFYGILMELCDLDLNRRILECLSARGAPEGLPVDEAKDYAACIVVALEHLHNRWILFRDLKPENVLTAFPESGGSRRLAKLADFGLARRVRVAENAAEDAAIGEEDGVVVCTTSLTGRVGTLAFMAAVESEAGNAEDPGTPVGADVMEPWRIVASRDWYSMGCCLMLMLLGERGGRLSQQRAVLLPPPQGELRGALLAQAGVLSPAALGLLLALTADSARERAGAEELRQSDFLGASIAEAELLARRSAAGAKGA